MAADPNQLADLFAGFGIDASTTRSAAKRTKRFQGRINCIQCLKMFLDLDGLIAHLLDQPGHLASRTEIKKDHEEAKAELAAARASGDPDRIEVAEFNKMRALVYVTALEKLRRHRGRASRSAATPSGAVDARANLSGGRTRNMRDAAPASPLHTIAADTTVAS